ncbi:MAG: tRNA pseudouridine synthase 1, partial [Paramarteilia canceri]
ASHNTLNPNKKRCIMILSYNGDSYHGLQFSKDAPTIEGEIMQALLKSRAISEKHFLNLNQ